MNKFIFFGIALCITLYLTFTYTIEDKKNEKVESFVIKKKKKGVSKSKLQQKLGKAFGDQLSCAPAVHRKIAKVQSKILKEVYKYLENDKNCVVLKLKKREDIDKTITLAKNFEKKMNDFCRECETYLSALS